MARKFFFVAAGLLMLALSYHFGAGTSLAPLVVTCWHWPQTAMSTARRQAHVHTTLNS